MCQASYLLIAHLNRLLEERVVEDLDKLLVFAHHLDHLDIDFQNLVLLHHCHSRLFIRDQEEECVDILMVKHQRVQTDLSSLEDILFKAALVALDLVGDL